MTGPIGMQAHTNGGMTCMTLPMTGRGRGGHVWRRSPMVQLTMMPPRPSIPEHRDLQDIPTGQQEPIQLELQMAEPKQFNC